MADITVMNKQEQEISTGATPEIQLHSRYR